MNFENWFSEQSPDIALPSAGAVLRLSAEGATVPFMARYRKEQTGNLDEVAIQKVLDLKEDWDLILHRQKFIVEEIERQRKLTPELKDKILSTFNSTILEDLYLPFKLKRKTKAAAAKDAGLEPLADWIWNCGHGTETPQPGQTLELWAFTFHNADKGFADAQACIDGAQDILIERLSENQDLRALVRKTLFEEGHAVTRKGEKVKPNSKFENYFESSEDITSLLKPQNSHRYLAMRRGWMEEELTLKIGPANPETDAEAFEQPMLGAFERVAYDPSVPTENSPGAAVLTKAARLAFKAHVLPSIENEVHKALKDVADEAAINVFAENVRKLLLASPYGAKGVLGVDPGIRTGCKLALVNSSGAHLANSVMYLDSEEKRKKAKAMLIEIAKSGNIAAIAVGNGTAGRETEQFIRTAFKEESITVPVVMVNEAGASVYSASEVAREEFPDLDITVRGAISIARRLQDPLSELVKIDPKSIGVGQYQHDVSQTKLKRTLDQVVDSCVNQVGVDLNTASVYLLSHVSGIGESLAKSVVQHRETKGLFASREQLQDVSRFTKKAFEQAAGFLRIRNTDQPLDNTGIHPERYPLLEKLATKLGKTVKDLVGPGVQLIRQDKEFRQEVGEFTFADIVAELEKPGRDPRDEFVVFQFREDIHQVKDLQPGMLCPGIVTNVTNFGAFVDIGVHQDGLVHISQLGHQFVKDPREAVSPGDHVQVKVLEVNLDKNQIALTMKLGEKPAQKSTRGRGRGREEGRERRPESAPAPRPALKPSGAPSPISPRTAPMPAALSASPPGKRAPGGPKPKEAFNNPFASLAGMKKELKTK